MRPPHRGGPRGGSHNECALRGDRCAAERTSVLSTEVRSVGRRTSECRVLVCPLAVTVHVSAFAPPVCGCQVGQAHAAGRAEAGAACDARAAA